MKSNHHQAERKHSGNGAAVQRETITSSRKGRAGDSRPPQYRAGTRFIALMHEDGRGGGTSEEVMHLGALDYDVLRVLAGSRGRILDALIEAAFAGLNPLKVARITKGLGDLEKEIQTAQGLIVLLVQSCRPGNARHQSSRRDYTRLTCLARSNKLEEVFAQLRKEWISICADSRKAVEPQRQAA